MRTLVDIPEDDIRWLDGEAEALGKSRAALVRDAVSAYRARHNDDRILRGAGYWKDREDIGDAIEYQRELRRDRDEP